MKVDYIIVGFGLAGLAVVETLEQQRKSYVVFDDASQQSSLVAASVYNPVVLKRFTAVRDAKDQLERAQRFYGQVEDKFKKHYDDKFDILRLFASVEEQNNWFTACDKPVLSEFLVSKVINNSNRGIHAPYGFGQVRGTGRLRTTEVLHDYKTHLADKARFISSTFDYDQLEIQNSGVSYKEFKAEKVIFCEGFGLKKNPYFKELPLVGTKGELLIIRAPKLRLSTILKGSVFVLPLGDDLYKVGATFNHSDKSSESTAQGKAELIRKLEAIITVPYEIIQHEAGVRPTTKDRRPLLGKHHKYNKLAILNGLGTRGVLLAPKMAQLLIAHIESQEALPKELSIDRFR